ncbi:hypothetical protein NECAME_08206 [Necator americanus]|uniref:Uncharacterized protein n=1 Tax=Necator americanus TaxID=51031 RepID=W2TJS6_NECAM|nr:hypothetical protein NECAME_08206 [Necator americanus]ETN82053.1 hypothetical protein NECAME_08206 [Necator americanus]
MQLAAGSDDKSTNNFDDFYVKLKQQNVVRTEPASISLLRVKVEKSSLAARINDSLDVCEISSKAIFKCVQDRVRVSAYQSDYHRRMDRWYEGKIPCDMVERLFAGSCHILNWTCNDSKTLHDFLEAVCMDGIAVIKNGPIGTRLVVPNIGERIGLIHSTHFG